MTSTMKNALLFVACICLFLLGAAEAQNTTTNWTHIRNTPTTVAGYGIGDVWTRTQADTRYAPIVVPYANLATLPGGTLLGNASAGAAAPAAITIGSGLSLSVGGVLSASGGGGGGTVTTVVCGTGLTGGTITTTGTCAASFGTTAGTIAQGNDARIGAINGVTVSGTPVAGYVPTATSASTATWQAPTGGGGGAVSSFNSRVGAVVPAAGDYPPYLGGVGHRAGRRAWIGDSITARNNKTTPSINERSASGYAIWLNALCGQCFEMPVQYATASTFTSNSLNFGVSGQGCGDILARLSAIISQRPDDAFLLCGTNDFGAKVSLATVQGQLNSIIQQLGAAGIPVTVSTVYPRSAANLTALGMTTGEVTTAKGAIEQFNQYIRRYNITTAPTSGYKIRVVDPWSYMVDPASAVGDPRAGCMVDGLHPLPACAYAAARAEWDQEAGNLPPSIITTLQSAGNVYNATSNPGGNLLVNGFMAGTAGTLNGSGVSGQVPDGWTMQRQSTYGTGVGSINSTFLDGTPGSSARQVWTTNGTATPATPPAANPEFVGFLLQTVSSNFTAGDVVEATCVVNVSGLSGNNLVGVALVLLSTGGAGQTYYDLNPIDSTQPFPQVPFASIRRTNRLTVQSGATALTVRVETHLDGSVVGSATVDVGRCSLAKVPAAL